MNIIVISFIRILGWVLIIKNTSFGSKRSLPYGQEVGMYTYIFYPCTLYAKNILIIAKKRNSTNWHVRKRHQYVDIFFSSHLLHALRKKFQSQKVRIRFRSCKWFCLNLFYTVDFIYLVMSKNNLNARIW